MTNAAASPSQPRIPQPYIYHYIPIGGEAVDVLVAFSQDRRRYVVSTTQLRGGVVLGEVWERLIPVPPQPRATKPLSFVWSFRRDDWPSSTVRGSSQSRDHAVSELLRRCRDAGKL